MLVSSASTNLASVFDRSKQTCKIGEIKFFKARTWLPLFQAGTRPKRNVTRASSFPSSLSLVTPLSPATISPPPNLQCGEERSIGRHWLFTLPWHGHLATKPWLIVWPTAVLRPCPPWAFQGGGGIEQRKERWSRGRVGGLEGKEQMTEPGEKEKENDWKKKNSWRSKITCDKTVQNRYTLVCVS